MKSKIRSASWLGIITIFVGILNYLTYPILMRYLSVEQYAEISVLQSIFAIITIPLGGFSLLMLVEFRENFLNIQKNQKKFFVKNMRLTAYYIAFLLIVLPISYFVFRISSLASLVLLFLISTFAIFSSFYYALLQATEKFVFLGFLNFFVAIIRFALTFLLAIFPLIWVGFLPFTISSIVCFIVYVIVGQKILNNPPQYITNTKDVFISQEKSFGKYIFIIGLLTLLQSIDVLLVRKIFDDYTVAVYASVAIIIKFAGVFIGVIETISLPTLVDVKYINVHGKYIYNLIAISIVGFLISIFMLPYAGNYVLTVIKDGLEASYYVWVCFGIAVVSLGFFSIFIKLLIVRSRSFWSIFILPICLVTGFLFVKSIEEFTLLIMVIFLCLYLGSIYKILKK